MHFTIRTPLRAGLLAASLGGALLFTPWAQAASPQMSQYQKDVERCNTTPGIDKAACLKEAGAAAQAARQDQLTNPGMGTETTDRTRRCDALTGDQREECIQLMNSSDTRTQGSVEGGGVLRELTITVPAPTPGT